MTTNSHAALTPMNIVAASPAEMPGILAQLTAHVVGIRMATSVVEESSIAELFRTVHHELSTIASTAAASGPAKGAMPQEACQDGQVDADRWPGVFEERIVCLEDGKTVTLLKSHLNKRHAMRVEEYLRKWNLPADYPFVPPAYVAKKRLIAEASGLGTKVRANRERKKGKATA